MRHFTELSAQYVYSNVEHAAQYYVDDDIYGTIMNCLNITMRNKIETSLYKIALKDEDQLTSEEIQQLTTPNAIVRIENIDEYASYCTLNVKSVNIEPLADYKKRIAKFYVEFNKTVKNKYVKERYDLKRLKAKYEKEE